MIRRGLDGGNPSAVTNGPVFHGNDFAQNPADRAVTFTELPREMKVRLGIIVRLLILYGNNGDSNWALARI